MVSYGNQGYNLFGLAKERSELSSQAAKSFLFYDLCKYLEANPSMTKQKFNDLLDSFYKKVSIGAREEDENYSAYPLIRLLMPVKDQRKRLTDKMFRDALAFFITVPVPLKGSAEGYAKFVVQNYTPSSINTLSIYNVNHFLKTMAVERSKKNQVIQEFCSKMSPLELTWLFRIVLQEVSDVVVGRSHGRGLVDLTNYLSPKADKLFQSGMDLESLCIGIYQAKYNKIDLSNALILGKPLRPMLLSRIGCNTEDFMTMIKNCGRPFYVETKYDGEHFLLHRLNHGKEYKLFSRRGLEHTDGLNALSIFAKKLHPYFKNSVVDCVLDGELCVMDLKTNNIVGKNVENEEGAILDVKHMTDGQRYKRVFVVFDILVLNGQELFEKPLINRLKALSTKVFEDTDPNTVFISHKTEMTKVKDLQSFYFEHLKNGEEGVVVKGKNSIYNFGQRSAANGWFKIKPDYGPRAIIDVVVVGARYENNTYDNLRSFEIATLAGNGSRFRIIGGVQARLKKHDLAALVDALKLKKENTKRPPYLEGVSGEKTTLYADLSDVQVVEVKASGVINNKLQFPVITGFRPDKTSLEISTWQEIADYGKKLRSRKRIMEGGNSVFTVQAKKMRREIMNKAHNHTSKRGKKNTVLKGVNVYLINDLTKKDQPKMLEAEETLKHFGAEIYKNYSDKVNFAVSPKATGISTRSTIKRGRINVISMDWVKRCEEANKALQWSVEDEIIYRCEDDAYNLFDLDDTTAINEDEPEDELDTATAVPDDFDNDQDNLETQPMDTQNVDMAEQEMEDRDVGASVDQKIEADSYNNVKIETRSQSSSNLENEGTLGLDDLSIEREDENEVIAQERYYEEEDIPLPDDLFYGFNVFVYKSQSNNEDLNYEKKIEKCGATISSRLDQSITHIFFKDRYNFGADQLGIGKWLNENQWLSLLINKEWIDKAIREDDRYLDSVAVSNLSTVV